MLVFFSLHDQFDAFGAGHRMASSLIRARRVKRLSCGVSFANNVLDRARHPRRNDVWPTRKIWFVIIPENTAGNISISCQPWDMFLHCKLDKYVLRAETCRRTLILFPFPFAWLCWSTQLRMITLIVEYDLVLKPTCLILHVFVVDYSCLRTAISESAHIRRKENNTSYKRQQTLR